METRHYEIHRDDRYRIPLRLFWGVTPERAWATVDDEHLVARLGWWEISIPVAEISSWRIEGPWRTITALGVRRSVRHGDVSFAGSARGGVTLDLRNPVKWTVFHVPMFSVGVEDLEGLAEALRELGIPGEDARSAPPAASL